MKLTIGLLVLSVLSVAAGCSGSDDPTAAAVKQYAINLDQNYKDVIPKLEALQTAVMAFTAHPTPEGLTAAQQAYLAARPAYSESEYSRFYGGPIDQAQGGMNEWPIDEAFIDYTVANPMGGIINNPQGYPQITAPVIASADERGGLENLSTGYHAVEFLLWGQRPDQNQGPGERPYTDYLDGGPVPNPDRRRTYLQVATDLLLDDMRGLDGAWDLTNKDSYGAKFVADTPINSLTKMYRGFSQMAISELFYERIQDAFVSKDQKDEEACFSEGTLPDLVANALGIEDAYLGRYQAKQGASISDLVKAKSPSLDAQIRTQLSAIQTAIGAIPPPFDHAVLAPAGSPANLAMQQTVMALMPLQGLLDQAAMALGIVNNL